MASLSYEEKNKKYRKDIQRNYAYLTGAIPLGIILPYLHDVLHPSDYERLGRRVQNYSDWDCNQDLLNCLQKREYWWRAFREALASINCTIIIQRLGWDDNTFDFGPSDESTIVGQNSGASYNPPENREKNNKKQQTVEEFMQQNDMAKGSNSTKNGKQHSEQRDVDPNLSSDNLEQFRQTEQTLEEITQQKLDFFNSRLQNNRSDPNLSSGKYEEKKLNTDFKLPTDENDLGKVLEPEIHPAVRQNLPLNFPNSDKKWLEASDGQFRSTERTARDEINANYSPATNSPPSMDKLSNSQSLQSVNVPPKLDHRSISAPTICSEPGAVCFPPNHTPVRQTEIPGPRQNASTSPIHHSLSAPSVNRAKIHKRQQQYADVEQENENSAQQSTITTSGPVANFEPSNGRSNAQKQEIDLREKNSELCDILKEENRSNPGSSRSQKFEDVVDDGPTSATAFQEILPQTSVCQSYMASMTTNDDVIKPSIASTVDPKGVSRKNNVRGEQAIRHKSSNINREPDSYVTGLHSYGSDVTSSIRSGGQSSAFESQDNDQTEAKTFDSVVDALDDWNLDSILSNRNDPSSIGSPDAMRFVSGSTPSAPSAADDDVLTTESAMGDLQRNSSSSAQQNASEMQNSASVENSASAQNNVGTMPKFDSLLSSTGSQQSLLRNANQNVALSDLPLAQAGNSNVPEFAELLSQESSVDPADYSEAGDFSPVSVANPPSSRRTDDSEAGPFSPVSVAHPPSSTQLAGLNRVSINENQDHEGGANAEDEPPPSILRRISNSFLESVERVYEAVIP